VVRSAVLSGSFCATRDFIPRLSPFLLFSSTLTFLARTLSLSLSLSLLDRLTILLDRPSPTHLARDGDTWRRRRRGTHACTSKRAVSREHAREIAAGCHAVRGQCRLAPFFARCRYPVGNYSSPPTCLSCPDILCGGGGGGCGGAT